MNIYKAVASQLTPYEPNWFLSTIVQSTAGFIAIMAGFQLNRLITLNSEKRTLEMRLAELETRRHLLNDEIRKDNRVLIRQTIKWFEDNCIETIVENPNQNLEDLVSENRFRGDDFEKTLAHANEMAELVKSLTEQIEKLFSGAAYPPATEELLISAGIPLRTELEKRIGVAVSARIARSRKTGIGAILANQHNYVVPIFNERVYQRQDDLISERDAKKEQLRYLEGEMGGVAAQVMNIPTYKTMLHGFAILIYFAVIGIVYPLYEMSHNPTQLNIAHRSFILWGYSLGLIWLLLHILWQSRKLLVIQERWEEIRSK
jgi:hypothetical protein